MRRRWEATRRSRRAGVFEDSAAIRSDPDETENGSVKRVRGGPEVVQR